MDRVALLHHARDLQRRIWASLPLGFRLVAVLERLAVDSITAFGQVLYAEFLLRGVKGLPDIDGMPALDWLAANPDLAKDKRKITARLAREGDFSRKAKDFASRTYRFLMAKFHNPALVEESMQSFLVRFISGAAEGMTEGSDLKRAEGYATEGVKREVLNAITRQNRQRGREQSIFMEDDDEEVAIDISDPKAFKDIESIFPEWHDPRVKRDLAAIAPWVPTYLDLAAKGYTDDEIFGFSASQPYSGMLKSELAEHMGWEFVPRPGSKEPLGRGIWSKPGTGTKKRIVEVLNDHLRGD